MNQSPTSSPGRTSRQVLRLLNALTVFLALGDLVWFIGTFPGYFRWFSQGWMNPSIPLLLLWTFIGLPSLVCGTLAMRMGRSSGTPGRWTTAAFWLVLAVCTLVPLLASLASWNSGTGTFPWGVWLATSVLAVGLWFFALRFRVPSTPPA
jgi:hypothetical protein